MTLVAPVNLPYNVKTLWFDPNGLDIHAGDELVVETARGVELGVAQSDIQDMPEERVSSLKSPLKPVLRLATEEDLARAEEMESRAREAMPVFRELARETDEDMHPVSVEYMLDGDKAVFYFESEKRIDFRELVRKLASRFHVRIDMKQIGVRDEARIVGGIAHCGQLVCCKRLGGEFKPVSIRMAKDQDLSLNSQKISGLCGRLMCCLRYEEDTYKEVKATSPKVGAKALTPLGPGKVTNIDVPTETISVRVGDDKPVKVPISAVVDLSDDRKSCTIDDDEWNEAIEEATSKRFGNMDLFNMPNFTGEDKVGEAKAVHNERPKKDRKGSGSSSGTKKRRSRSKSGKGSKAQESSSGQQKARSRRRSTKINAASGEKEQVERKVRPGHKSSGLSHASDEEGSQKKGSGSKRRSNRRRGKGSSGQKGTSQQKSTSNASDQHRNDAKGSGSGTEGDSSKGQGQKRRRRRRRRSSGGSNASGAQGSSGSGGSNATGSTGSKGSGTSADGGN